MFGPYWSLIWRKCLVWYRSHPGRYEVNQADMEESISALLKSISALLNPISALTWTKGSTHKKPFNPSQLFCWEAKHVIYRILHGYFHIGPHICPWNPYPALATHICPRPAGSGWYGWLRQDMDSCGADMRADMGIPMWYYVHDTLNPHVC